MQKLIYAFAFAALLTACGNGAGKQSGQAAEEETASSSLVVDGKMGDPVCEMPYDTSYTEYSLYKGDTVHFCSTTCKGVFDKNPDKYAANLK